MSSTRPMWGRLGLGLNARIMPNLTRPMRRAHVAVRTALASSMTRIRDQMPLEGRGWKQSRRTPEGISWCHGMRRDSPRGRIGEIFGRRANWLAGRRRRLSVAPAGVSARPPGYRASSVEIARGLYSRRHNGVDDVVGVGLREREREREGAGAPAAFGCLKAPRKWRESGCWLMITLKV